MLLKVLFFKRLRLFFKFWIGVVGFMVKLDLQHQVHNLYLRNNSSNSISLDMEMI